LASRKAAVSQPADTLGVGPPTPPNCQRWAGGPGGRQSRPGEAVTTGDGITHRIIVTTSAAYPIKGLDAQIAHRTNTNLGTFSPGRSFENPVTENAQVRYMCFVRVPPNVQDATPTVRFTDRNGHRYYSYRGYARRFGQNT
jgi:hypothetical protein